jgi:hypothetical protein
MRRRTGRLARWNRGATRLGFTDVLILLIVLAILLWASWKQFPAYKRPPAPVPLVTPVPLPATRHAPGASPRRTSRLRHDESVVGCAAMTARFRISCVTMTPDFATVKSVC